STGTGWGMDSSERGTGGQAGPSQHQTITGLWVQRVKGTSRGASTGGGLQVGRGDSSAGPRWLLVRWPSTRKGWQFPDRLGNVRPTDLLVDCTIEPPFL